MRYVDSPLGTKVSVIGLGTWQFGSKEWGYGSAYEERTAGLVERALDSGITVLDTAEIYGTGRSERLLGAALRERREEAVVATKIFPVFPIAPVVEQRAVASANRLGVQRLDLYQVHQPNPVVSDARTMAGMRALQDVGLVDQVGVSNYSLERWVRAEEALGRPVLSNQVQYSLAHRGPEDDLLPYAAAKDRLVIAYSPLAQGLLSGRYSADNPPAGRVRRINPLFLPENLERAAPLLATLREVADAHDVTMSQAALAYLVHHPGVVAIPGASSLEQVESNAVAGEIELADDEVAALARAARDFRPVTGRHAVAPMVRAARERR
ncbi:aldo/keto reductase [Isoptericola sp. b441]|uniref:Aldo/keto reductase n=1 Tax=Actinotalea lenta TaxID=3064654 RepID=A0ABT9DBT3_9CELL|nr:MULTISPECIES: aldo/keto reductase [unclassified Isoptericola]MDO8108055.1 aldo/keto reductase [Isoptericola sp. b441]MDO8120276.1 aldo/keto reductase [Isoptericola sp. b490]